MKKRLENLLEESKVARDGDSSQLEIEFYCKYICKNNFERKIIREVLSRDRPSGATLKRKRALMQNTLGLYQATEVVKQKRNNQEEVMREEYSQKDSTSGLFDSLRRWYTKF